MSKRRLLLLGLGPVLAAITYAGLSGSAAASEQAAHITLAIGVWMAFWWITESISLAKTALIPLIVFPVLGISPVADVAQSYFHPLIFLFLYALCPENKRLTL